MDSLDSERGVLGEDSLLITETFLNSFSHDDYNLSVTASTTDLLGYS